MIKEIIKLTLVLLSMIMLVACLNTSISKINIEENNSKIQEISKGSYINLDDDIFTVYYYGEVNQYNDIESIITYNEESKGYVELSGDSIYVVCEEKEIKLEGDISRVEFSLNGQMLMYFKRGEILAPKILDINSNEIFEIESKVVISGGFIEWISNNQIIYYGIDIENNINGLFLYNINTGEEKTLYRIEKGYIEYIKNLNNKVIFVENNFKNKVVKEIDNDGNIKEITNEMAEIQDIEILENKYYIMGKNTNSLYSLYEVLNGEVKRIIYDFPYIVDFNEGISLGEDGGVLFIGSNENLDKKYVYKYIDDKIARVSSGEGQYRFIN